MASIKHGVTQGVDRERAAFGDATPLYYHGIDCEHGRHRSLGIANLAKHCLEKIHDLKVNIHILSTVECGCPDNCKKLWNRPDYQQLRVQQFKDGLTAFRVAERLWLRA